MKYIMAHDMGTSSDKAVLIDFKGNIVASKAVPYPTYYPAPAFVEQEPEEYWSAVCLASKTIMEETGIDPKDVEGVIFSTQAMGIIPVDKNGRVLHRNITWVDGRAEKQAQTLMKKVGGKKIFTLVSGTPIMGKDVVSKIQWLKEERPDVYNNTKYFLDVNGYLKYKCTGEMVAELSGASSYGLDLKNKTWMSALKLIGIDLKKLPPLVKSTDKIGNGLTEDAAEKMGLCAGTAVFGGCDDTQAAAIGSGMNGDGEIHIYLGTSAWVAASSKSKTKFKHGAAAIQSADPEMNLICGITEAAGAKRTWRRYIRVYGQSHRVYPCRFRSFDMHSLDAWREMSGIVYDDESNALERDSKSYKRAYNEGVVRGYRLQFEMDTRELPQGLQIPLQTVQNYWRRRFGRRLDANHRRHYGKRICNRAKSA